MDTQELYKILVTDGEDTATVGAFVKAYREAHPTLNVTAVDDGEQVFIGDALSGIGINVDRVTTPKVQH